MHDVMLLAQQHCTFYVSALPLPPTIAQHLDAAILQEPLADAVNASFNCISIDADTSSLTADS